MVLGTAKRPIDGPRLEFIPAPHWKSKKEVEVDEVVWTRDVTKRAPTKIDWKVFGVKEYSWLGSCLDAKRFDTLSDQCCASEIFCHGHVGTKVLGLGIFNAGRVDRGHAHTTSRNEGRVCQ